MTEVLTEDKRDEHDPMDAKEMDVLTENNTENPIQLEEEPFYPFSEIIKLDDSIIQRAIQKIGNYEFAKALKAEDSIIQNKVFKNMTKRASTMLKEDMEYMGPIRLRDVEDAQKNILLFIQHLANTGQITIPDDFHLPDDLDQAFAILHPPSTSLPDNTFKNIEEFKTFLTERRQPEEPYGLFAKDITMCSFFDSKNNENILADIMHKNETHGMGNFQIPKTNIKLINYSICPKCKYVFSFKDLVDYYANPKRDMAFTNRAEQYREDTRVLCNECNTYFLPALIIVDGSPKNEVQFLCRVQTINAIERFYREWKGKSALVLSAKKENILERGEVDGKKVRAVLNDILLKELSPKPTLISNLLQYTPANLALNLINGVNIEKGDILFGTWQ
jgi:hypothetical protein